MYPILIIMLPHEASRSKRESRITLRARLVFAEVVQLFAGDGLLAEPSEVAAPSKPRANSEP